MSKTPNHDIKSAASFISTLSQILLRASLTVLRVLVIIALLIAAFPLLYEMKTRAGIDLVPGIHAGSFLEEHTHGLVKCEWLYPYHCPPLRAEAAK